MSRRLDRPTVAKCATSISTAIRNLVDSCARGCARPKDSQGRTFLACARCNVPMKSVSRLLCVCVVQGRARCGRKLQSAVGDESRLISVIEFRTRSRFYVATYGRIDAETEHPRICANYENYLLKLVSILEAIN